MQAVTFRHHSFGCGCCGSDLVCADGVHLQRNYQNDGKTNTWQVIGYCGGSCYQELNRKVAELVREFKRTDERRQWSEFQSSGYHDADADFEEWLEFEENQALEGADARLDWLEHEQEQLECCRRRHRRWR